MERLSNDVLALDGVEVLRRTLDGTRIDSPTSPERPDAAKEEAQIAVTDGEMQFASGQHMPLRRAAMDR